MVSPQAALPVAGDLVEVTWGFDVVPATVLSVYNTARGPRVTVAVPLLGPDGEVLDENHVTLPIDAVRRL
jgi:hypothetical protein